MYKQKLAGTLKLYYLETFTVGQWTTKTVPDLQDFT